MYIVGDDCRPAPIADKVLARIDRPHFTTELARFNLEANFPPQLFAGDFLKRLETDLKEAIGEASTAASGFGANILLTGILPTLRAEDLVNENLTPEPRFEFLNEALFRSRDTINVVIDGIEQYQGTFDSVILEGANTSFQLHLQVEPDESAQLYNLMQLVTAPLLAAATNSPVLLGRRLWHETRVAVFERSLDERTASQLARGFPSRVGFGDAWLKDSIIELFRDNAARFPAILTRDLDEDSLDVVEQGRTPQLAALTLHNGTVWRWNRPCYGVTDGVAHLRIENRVLPSGPSIVDEVANATLFYGMMAALPASYDDVAGRLAFDEAKTNFLNAARHGLSAQFTWLDDRSTDARTLLLEELIPAARQGLASVGVPDDQIGRYLGIIEARVTSGQTGAAWLLNTFQARRGNEPEAIWHDAVSTMLEEQKAGRPVHEWGPARQTKPLPGGEPNVASIMTTDLFTVRPDEVLDLAISVMDWKHVRHIPVEGENGQLLGVLTVRDLLRVSQGQGGQGEASAPEPVAVKTLMRTDIIEVDPGTTLRKALSLMRGSDLGCLMVVAHGRLIGIVTERDLVEAAGDLLEGRET